MPIKIHRRSHSLLYYIELPAFWSEAGSVHSGTGQVSLDAPSVHSGLKS